MKKGGQAAWREAGKRKGKCTSCVHTGRSLVPSRHRDNTASGDLGDLPHRTWEGAENEAAIPKSG